MESARILSLAHRLHDYMLMGELGQTTLSQVYAQLTF